MDAAVRGRPRHANGDISGRHHPNENIFLEQDHCQRWWKMALGTTAMGS